MKFYRNLSPATRFVIGETARVCACIGIIVFGSMAVDKVAAAIAGPSSNAMVS